MLHNTAVYEGHRHVLVRTSDSDVGVLWTVVKLGRRIDDLWVALGTAKHFK